jgi:large subunit ribosomal protein L7/L12
MADDAKKADTAKKAETKAKDKGSDVKVSPKLQKVIDQVEKLTVLELAELVTALEDKFGVSAAAPVAVAAAPGAAANGGEADAAEEKSEYDVIVTDAGANKVSVIKAIREINQDLGLMDAKKAAESLPYTLLEAAKKEEAEAVKKKLEEAGAQVELK